MEDESMFILTQGPDLPTSSYIIIMHWPDVSTTGAQAIGDLCQELTKGVIWNIVTHVLKVVYEWPLKVTHVRLNNCSRQPHWRR